jgi:hypothetical protein
MVYLECQRQKRRKRAGFLFDRGSQQPTGLCSKSRFRQMHGLAAASFCL